VRRSRRTEVTADDQALADTGPADDQGLADTGTAGDQRLADTGPADSSGASVSGAAGAPAMPMPPALIAAAGRPERDVAVRLDVAGTEAIAIIGGAGDPRAWWTAVWDLAGPQRRAR